MALHGYGFSGLDLRRSYRDGFLSGASVGVLVGDSQVAGLLDTLWINGGDLVIAFFRILRDGHVGRELAFVVGHDFDGLDHVAVLVAQLDGDVGVRLVAFAIDGDFLARCYLVRSDGEGWGFGVLIDDQTGINALVAGRGGRELNCSAASVLVCIRVLGAVIPGACGGEGGVGWGVELYGVFAVVQVAEAVLAIFAGGRDHCVAVDIEHCVAFGIEQADTDTWYSGLTLGLDSILVGVVPDEVTDRSAIVAVAIRIDDLQDGGVLVAFGILGSDRVVAVLGIFRNGYLGAEVPVLVGGDHDRLAQRVAVLVGQRDGHFAVRCVALTGDHGAFTWCNGFRIHRNGSFLHCRCIGDAGIHALVHRSLAGQGDHLGAAVFPGVGVDAAVLAHACRCEGGSLWCFEFNDVLLNLQASEGVRAVLVGGGGDRIARFACYWVAFGIQQVHRDTAQARLAIVLQAVAVVIAPYAVTQLAIVIAGVAIRVGDGQRSVVRVAVLVGGFHGVIARNCIFWNRDFGAEAAVLVGCDFSWLANRVAVLVLELDSDLRVRSVALAVDRGALARSHFIRVDSDRCFLDCRSIDDTSVNGPVSWSRGGQGHGAGAAVLAGVGVHCRIVASFCWREGSALRCREFNDVLAQCQAGEGVAAVVIGGGGDRVALGVGVGVAFSVQQVHHGTGQAGFVGVLDAVAVGIAPYAVAELAVATWVRVRVLAVWFRDRQVHGVLVAFGVLCAHAVIAWFHVLADWQRGGEVAILIRGDSDRVADRVALRVNQLNGHVRVRSVAIAGHLGFLAWLHLGRVHRHGGLVHSWSVDNTGINRHVRRSGGGQRHHFGASILGCVGVKSIVIAGVGLGEGCAFRSNEFHGVFAQCKPGEGVVSVVIGGCGDRVAISVVDRVAFGIQQVDGDS